MAKGIYAGVDGIKKVKKLFVGVGGAARKVKKVFAGVGGVPKLVYSADLAKIAGLTPLAGGSFNIQCGGSNNTHGIFASPQQPCIDAYNSSLVRSTPTLLAKYNGFIGAPTHNNNPVIFAGAENNGVPLNLVYAYDHSLVLNTSTKFATARWNSATAYNSALTLFIGGDTANTYTALSSEVSGVNSSLVVSRSWISYKRNRPAGGAVGDYALTVGGVYDGNFYGEVEYWDSSLVHGDATDLSTPRSGALILPVGNHALIIGGTITVPTNIIEVYDLSVVKCASLADPNNSKDYISGTSVDGYAIYFTTPELNSSTSTLQVYDTSLVRSTLQMDYSRKTYYAKSINIGDTIVLIAGGYSSDHTAIDGFTA